MKKIILSLSIVLLLFACTSCGKEVKISAKEPNISQMKAICELAVMDCYYHNVAKYFEKDASGFLLWKKDKKFWIEYSGVVRVGIDASQIEMEINDSEVTITIPKARVMSCTVDQNSLTKDSFIVSVHSAKVKAEDEKEAFAEAQENMEKEAENDATLLASAEQRVQDLLEEYVNNIGNAIGKEYAINWKYKDDTTTSMPDDDTTEKDE